MVNEFTKQSDDNDIEHYQRVTPLLIGSYFLRGFSTAIGGNLISVIVSNTGLIAGAIVLSDMFFVPWSWRIFSITFCVLSGQLIIAFVKYYLLRYRVDAKSISTKSGVILHKEISCEWRHVRSILLTQSPIQRQLGFANVSLTTAHISENTIEVPFIPLSMAREWQNLVEQLSRQKFHSTHVTAPDLSETPKGHIRHVLRPKEVILSTLVSGPIFGSITIGFVLLGLVYCFVRYLIHLVSFSSSPDLVHLVSPTGFYDELYQKHISWIFHLPDQFSLDVASVIDASQQLFGIPITALPAGQILFCTSFVGALAVVFYLFGLVAYFLLNYGYICKELGNNLHLKRGLITKHSLTVRKDHIQTSHFELTLREQALQRGTMTLKQVRGNTLEFDIPFISNKAADQILQSIQESSRTTLTLSPLEQSFTPIHIMAFFHKLLLDLIRLLLTWGCVVILFPPIRGHFWPYLIPLSGCLLVSNFVTWRKKATSLKKTI